MKRKKDRRTDENAELFFFLQIFYKESLGRKKEHHVPVYFSNPIIAWSLILFPIAFLLHIFLTEHLC